VATVIIAPIAMVYEGAHQPLGGESQAVCIGSVSGNEFPDWGPTTYFTQGLYEPV